MSTHGQAGSEGTRLAGHEELRRVGTPQALGRYSGTWHLSSNHSIHIDCDTAGTRSYLLGVHMLDDIHEVWHAGEPLPHVTRQPVTPHRP